MSIEQDAGGDWLTNALRDERQRSIADVRSSPDLAGLGERVRRRQRQQGTRRRVLAGGATALLVLGAVSLGALRGNDGRLGEPSGSAQDGVRRIDRASRDATLPTDVYFTSAYYDANGMPDGWEQRVTMRSRADDRELGQLDTAPWFEDPFQGLPRLPGNRWIVGAPSQFWSAQSRCVNGLISVIDENWKTTPVLRARNIAVTPNGVLVAIRDVCPDGAAWGAEGTGWEVVRLDLSSTSTATAAVIVTGSMSASRLTPPGPVPGEAVDLRVSDDGMNVAVNMIDPRMSFVSPIPRWDRFATSGVNMWSPPSTSCRSAGSHRTIGFRGNQTVSMLVCAGRLTIELDGPVDGAGTSLDLGPFTDTVERTRFDSDGGSLVIRANVVLSRQAADGSDVAARNWLIGPDDTIRRVPDDNAALTMETSFANRLMRIQPGFGRPDSPDAWGPLWQTAQPGMTETELVDAMATFWGEPTSRRNEQLPDPCGRSSTTRVVRWGNYAVAFIDGTVAWWQLTTDGPVSEPQYLNQRATDWAGLGGTVGDVRTDPATGLTFGQIAPGEPGGDRFNVFFDDGYGTAIRGPVPRGGC